MSSTSTRKHPDRNPGRLHSRFRFARCRQQRPGRGEGGGDAHPGFRLWTLVHRSGEETWPRNIDLEVKVIEDITARNAGLSTGHLQCMMTTMDSTVVARAADIPVKHIAVPLMSYGLDEMVVAGDIESVEDFAGRALRSGLRVPQPHVDALDAETCGHGLRCSGTQDHAASGRDGRIRERSVGHRREFHSVLHSVPRAQRCLPLQEQPY